MSEEKKNPLAALDGIIAKVKELQQSNPMALYGAAGVIVVGVLFLAMSGGDGTTQIKINVSPGQTVTLENPNGGKSLIDQAAGMFSNREESDTFVCTVEKGVQAKVLDETVVNGLPFVRVELVSGACAGKSGFTAKTNIKP
jgi:hypothetical protein